MIYFWFSISDLKVHCKNNKTHIVKVIKEPMKENQLCQYMSQLF